MNVNDFREESKIGTDGSFEHLDLEVLATLNEAEVIHYAEELSGKNLTNEFSNKTLPKIDDKNKTTTTPSTKAENITNTELMIKINQTEARVEEDFKQLTVTGLSTTLTNLGHFEEYRIEVSSCKKEVSIDCNKLASRIRTMIFRKMSFRHTSF